MLYRALLDFFVLICGIRQAQISMPRIEKKIDCPGYHNF
jgi:hypothetical protein